GSFALGLGVYDKTNFLWIVAAAMAAAVVLHPRGVRDRISLKRIGVAVGAFVAGALPLVIYNLSWPPRTLAPIRAATVHLRGRHSRRGRAHAGRGQAAPPPARLPATAARRGGRGCRGRLGPLPARPSCRRDRRGRRPRGAGGASTGARRRSIGPDRKTPRAHG